MKKLMLVSIACFALAGCFDMPSPQDTQPTEKSKCAAIRAKMMQNQSNPHNNTPAAVSSSQQIDYQTLYHEECE